MASALDEAASLLRDRLRELDAERKKLQGALSNLTTGRGRRGPGRPPKWPQTGNSSRSGGPADQGEPRDHGLGGGQEDADQAELPVPGARRPPKGRPGEEVRPLVHRDINPAAASPTATLPPGLGACLTR